MTQTSSQLSSDEHEQVLQTIEMFEVIVQASPNDAQSLEILKDAYLRVGNFAEAVQLSRTLAEIYVGAMQFSAAVLEYELILQHEPDNVEVIAALGEIEERMQQAGQVRPPVPMQSINLDFHGVVSEGGSLMATSHTMRADGRRGSSAAKMEALAQVLTEDGNEALAKFLIQHRIAGEEVVKFSLERVSKKNKDLLAGAMATSLLDEVVRRGGLDLEATLCAIVDRSKFAYIPLEYYDVDRQIVKLLPESLTLGRLIVPFDVMSRTVMVATANPFDAQGKEAVQQVLDYNIQWHLASPVAITKILGDTYKVALPGVIGLGTGGPGAVASAPAPAQPGPLPDTSGFKLASSPK